MKIEEGPADVAPVSERPDGFDLFYKRRSLRRTYQYEMEGEQFYFDCFRRIYIFIVKNGTEYLRKENWEPEQIVDKLPTFLQFLRQMHFVNFNVKYPNLTSAADKSDGLAVLGVLIKAIVFYIHPVVGTTNAAFNNIANHFSKLVNKSSTVDGIASFSLAALLPNTTKFYRYSGSLTTPGCYESVAWTVFSEPIQVSSAQMAGLRQVMMNSTNSMENNFRPAQKLNGRTVYISYKKPSDHSTANPTAIPTKPDGAVVAKITTSLLLMMLFGALFLN
ncbi:hypothetical protein OS493_001331 [Desmophyllum pertusum]|uniref:carbonic anhydrase n=1 Tax=Desmophyllum pertusum TaxID=174260 RepID=A0A9X0D7Q3_9CNID|nr:hypothetical protein OS493_001331 [Desmophyllum pertusum]